MPACGGPRRTVRRSNSGMVQWVTKISELHVWVCGGKQTPVHPGDPSPPFPGVKVPPGGPYLELGGHSGPRETAGGPSGEHFGRF